MVLEQNAFVEQVLPSGVGRTLSDAEMAESPFRPFADPESRRPTLTWPRQIPIDGEPSDVHQIVDSYAEWLANSDVPKLFIKATPGATLSQGPALVFCPRLAESDGTNSPRHPFPPGGRS